MGKIIGTFSYLYYNRDECRTILVTLLIKYIFIKLPWNFFFFNSFIVHTGIPQWLSDKQSACNAGDSGDVGPTLGQKDSPGGGHGNPLQYAYLENPHEQRSLRATVRGIAKSQTRLKWLNIHSLYTLWATSLKFIFQYQLHTERPTFSVAFVFWTFVQVTGIEDWVK